MKFLCNFALSILRQQNQHTTKAMNKLLSLLFAISLPLLSGCGDNMKKFTVTHEADSEVRDIPSARTYMDNNTYIDIDVDALSERIISGGGTAQADSEAAEEMAMMRAALYRFYSHVELEGDRYVLSAKTAEELNVSQRVFDALRANMEEVNAQIKAANEAGEAAAPQEITDDYLEGLLN